MAPGGYIEHSEPIPELKTEDGSISPSDVMHRVTDLATEASQKFGKNIMIAPLIKNMIKEAGFVDVVEKRYKWPIGEWPVDRKLKDIGRWNMKLWFEGLETYTLRLLTQYCGVSQNSVQPSYVDPQERCSREGPRLTGEQWTTDDVKAWSGKMRTSLMNPKHHAYQTLYVALLYIWTVGLTRLPESSSTLGNRNDISTPL